MNLERRDIMKLHWQALIWIMAAAMGSLLLTGIQGRQISDTERKGRILRGKDPLVIVAIVVAVSQDAVVEGESASADIMLLKVESSLSGISPGNYVRADFNHHTSIKIDPEKARMQRQFLEPLRSGKAMKLHLRPPVEGVECRWSIPPPPKPGDEVGIETPVMIPIRGAKGYPDINTLPCYAFELNDIEEVVSPKNSK